MHHKPEKIVIFAASAHALKMNRYIDTHTHLYDEMFSEDADAAVRRALDAGVTQMIFPDIDASSRGAMMDLAAGFPGHIHTCLGLHPTSVDGKWRENLEEIEGMLDSRTVAIGETGMDCYWSTDFVKEQEEAFEWQVRLACREGLPVIIHSREATGRIFDVLAFRQMERYGDWYVGIGGVVTFRKAGIAETVKDIPLERIVLETDSPYLTPVPHRGERNESSYIPLIAGKIAMQKGIGIEEVAETTTANARKLFNI